jgi:hypothetical protein
MHPQTKPTTEDCAKLRAAAEAVGLTGLTVQKLLNGQYFTAPQSFNSHKIRSFLAPASSTIQPF